MHKKAMIVGANGQDGRLLSDLLQSRGYSVHPVTRDTAQILDPASVSQLVSAVQPNEIYYLVAHHHSSQDAPTDGDLQLFELSYQAHAQGLIHFLEAISTICPSTRLFYAASSLIFGTPSTALADESTPIAPVTPYGITKAMGIHICRYYRNQRNLFASVGILFNHESILRQEKFLSKKITQCVKRIQNGEPAQLVLGDLNAEADWGYAPDYVDAMNRILQLDMADDFVIATGVRHTVKDFVVAAFGHAGLPWEKHVSEKSSVLSRRNAAFMGNSAKLRALTGWTPSVNFNEMVGKLMLS